MITSHLSIRILVIAVILCTLFSAGCTSEKSDYDVGIAAYERGHYQAAMYDFETRAMRGDPVAQFCLGFMYKHGKGVTVSNEKAEEWAEEWYTKAAKQGYAPAQNNLGIIYFHRMEKALGESMENGLGGEASKTIRSYSYTATQWLQNTALEQNNSIAQYNLALGIHAWANGMDSFAKEWASLLKTLSTEDREKIIEDWEELAKSEEYEDTGQETLEVLRNPSAKVVEAYEEAVSWYTKAAKPNPDAKNSYKKGYAPAQNNLGEMYESGKGVDAKFTETERWKKAVEWYEKAAEPPDAEDPHNAEDSYKKGYAPAQNNLGRLYKSGKGVDENLTETKRWKEAVKWYKKAAKPPGKEDPYNAEDPYKKGYAPAQFNLAQMYYDGKGVEEDLTEPERWKEAVKWYTKAAKQENAEAQNNLARMYERGEGVPENLEMTARWLFRSAQLGNVKAQENLGKIFEVGLRDKNGEELITKDDAEAYYWYSLASDDNSDAEIVKALERVGNQLDDERKNEVRERVKQWKPRILWSNGTGFYIDEKHILTNAHVARRNSVDKYDELRVGYHYVEEKSGTEAVNPDVDLALLYDSNPLGNMDTFATFRSDPVESEEDIVSFGYPKSWVLSYDGNVTEGIVSGLSGMLNVPRPDNYFQHTAPIQGGNSGGPIFDRAGHVVGVTRYGMVQIEEGQTVEGGYRIKIDPPQNVNFAINFDVVEDFLRKNDIIPSTDNKEKISGKISEKARKFTFPVLCFRNKRTAPLSLKELSIEYIANLERKDKK